MEPSAWASKRKAIYLGGTVIALTAFSFLIFWKFWYQTPTCFDGLNNGDETGVDCGGSCVRVCSDAAVKPIVRFDPRIFKVSGNLYSVLALVENYNIDSWAPYAPYRFQIYDDKGLVIYERFGTTTLPRGETSAVFEGNIVIEGAEPKRVSFDLNQKISWQKTSAEKVEIKITNSPLLRQESAPRIEAEVQNESIEDIRNLELVAVIFDAKDNAVAASRTFIDLLKKGERANVFFTWPKPFDLGERICEKPSDTVLSLDRSGSMASLGKNPPEPLSSVKEAAANFVALLREGDYAGVVSFATDAKVETELNSDLLSVKNIVGSITIGDGSVQYTNIAEAISRSLAVLSSTTSNQLVGKNLILLTDGVATRPANPAGSKSEEEEIEYAENEAAKVAAVAKEQGVVIYTIGLGKDIHQNFLEKIASTPGDFFLAPATSTLEGIYKKISSSICKELPARVEIKYKILGE